MSFKIELANKDITEKLNTRLISLSFNDNKANETDTLELKFDNHKFQIEPPPEGSKLKLWIDGAFCGLFATDEVKISIKPTTLSIIAKSTDLTNILKQKKNRNHHDKSLKGILEVIAKDARMEYKVHKKLAENRYFYYVQNNESDLHFLTRLTRKGESIFKVNGNLLIFTIDGESVSGESLEIIHLNALTDISGGDFTSSNRNKYKSSVAYFKTPEMDKKQAVQAGAGQPIYFIKKVQGSEEQAKKLANSKMQELNASAIFGNIKLTKRMVKIKAGCRVFISNLHSKYNGSYIVEKVKHELGGNNTSSLEITKEFKIEN